MQQVCDIVSIGPLSSRKKVTKNIQDNKRALLSEDVRAPLNEALTIIMLVVRYQCNKLPPLPSGVMHANRAEIHIGGTTSISSNSANTPGGEKCQQLKYCMLWHAVVQTADWKGVSVCLVLAITISSPQKYSISNSHYEPTSITHYSNSIHTPHTLYIYLLFLDYIELMY